VIQALALRYHFAAMHSFMDGNGRTARALEALMLQRVGLPQQKVGGL
jgi:Fic family protein